MIICEYAADNKYLTCEKVYQKLLLLMGVEVLITGLGTIQLKSNFLPQRVEFATINI